MIFFSHDARDRSSYNCHCHCGRCAKVIVHKTCCFLLSYNVLHNMDDV